MFSRKPTSLDADAGADSDADAPLLPRCKLLQVGLAATFLNNLWIHLGPSQEGPSSMPFSAPRQCLAITTR